MTVVLFHVLYSDINAFVETLLTIILTIHRDYTYILIVHIIVKFMLFSRDLW